jgi:hypothetical protein
VEVSEEALAQIFATLTPHLDERRKRLLAGTQARALGRGGIAAVARASGMSRSTVQSGVRELDEGAEPSGRVRRPGAGRPRLIDKDPDLLLEFDDLVSPEARGDPMFASAVDSQVDLPAGRRPLGEGLCGLAEHRRGSARWHGL